MEVSRTERGVVVDLWSGLLRRVHLHVPEEWVPVAPEDPDEFEWQLDAARMRLRIREAPRFGIDVEVHNTHESEVFMGASPVLVLESPWPSVPWLAGAAGQVLFPRPGGGELFRQWRGHCGAPVGATARDGIALFGDAIWIRPGGRVGSGWRLEEVVGEDSFVDPAMLPRPRYGPEGMEIEIVAPDAAVVATGLQESTDDDATILVGPPGLHQVQLHDARGATTFEVGWHLELPEICSMAAARTEEPGLKAWLLLGAAGVRGMADPADVDELDELLGEALDSPSTWAVLAGLRAATTTGLPVRNEAQAAGRRLLETQTQHELGPLLRTQGMDVPTPGAGEGPALDWWRILTSDDDELRAQALAWVDQGCISSVPLAHGARGLALAALYCATRGMEPSRLAVHWSVNLAEARLLCTHSVEPDPAEVAWLLLAREWRAVAADLG